MSNPYFDALALEIDNGTRADAPDVNNVSNAVEAAFDLLPDPDLINQGRINWYIQAGVANAYTVTTGKNITILEAGLKVEFLVINSNTGPSTLDVDGIGPVAITDLGQVPLVGGEIITGQIRQFEYDGSKWILLLTESASAAAAAQAAAAAAALSAAAAALSETNAAASAVAAAASAAAAAASAALVPTISPGDANKLIKVNVAETGWDFLLQAIGNENIIPDAVQGSVGGGTANIQAGSIGTTDIQNDQVTNAKIPASAIRGSANSGGQTNVQANSIDTTDLASECIGNAQMQNNSIGQGEMLSNAIGQAELKDDVGSVSYSGAGNAHFVLPGGQYGFYPQYRLVSGTNIEALWISNNSTNTSYETRIWIDGEDFLGSDQDVRQRYFISSPPYDIGDGEIPLFVYAYIDSSGNVVGAYSAKTPPWAYNGPTDIRGKFCPKRLKKFKQSRGLIINSSEDFASYMDGDRVEAEEVEVTMDMQNADMAAVPHPIPRIADGDNNELVGGSIVLLDPCETLKLMDLHEEGEDINRLLMNNYLKVDNQFLENRARPSNEVNIMKIKWR